MPIRSPRWAARNGARATIRGSVAGRTVGRHGAAPGQVPDGEVLDPDRDLARARRTFADQRRRLEGELPAGPGCLATLGLEALEPRLVLVHLAELAMAPVALDELLLAGDRLGLVLDVLRRASVALYALPVVGAVVAAERRQPPVAQLPDAGHGRVEERPVVRGDEQCARPGAGGAPRAIRARRGRGGSSARRAGADRGPR